MPLKIPVWCTTLWQMLLPEAFKPCCYICNLCRQDSRAKYRIRMRLVLGEALQTGYGTRVKPGGKQANKRQICLENW